MLKFSGLWCQLCLPFQGQKSPGSPRSRYREWLLHLQPAARIPELPRRSWSQTAARPSRGFALKVTEAGGRERGQRQTRRGQNSAPGRVGAREGTGRTKEPGTAGAQPSQEAGRTSRREQFPRLTCQPAWV